MENFVAIDVETAGRRCSIASIGMVKYINGKKADTYYSLVNPQVEFTWGANRVNGLKDEVTSAPTFDAIADDVLNFIDDNLIVSYNNSTDIKQLFDTLKKFGISLNTHKIFDPMIIMQMLKEKNIVLDAKLTTAIEHFNLKLKNHHNALSDAEACGDLVVALIKDAKVTSIAKLAEYYLLILGTVTPTSINYTHGNDKNKHFSPIQLNSIHTPYYPIVENNLIKFQTTRDTEPAHEINEADVADKVFTLTGNFIGTTKNMIAAFIDSISTSKDLWSKNVTKKTEVLIVGIETKDGTGKTNKANDYIQNGQPIQIITDKQILDLMGINC